MDEKDIIACRLKFSSFVEVNDMEIMLLGSQACATTHFAQGDNGKCILKRTGLLMTI